MKKLVKNQSIQKTIDQLIRYYRVPVDASKEDALNAILVKIDRNEKSKYSGSVKTVAIRRIRIAAAVAAVAALLVVVYLFTATTQYTRVDGITTSIRLPDNSRVVLEENSRLSLKKYFWNRNVTLEGAAYFEVEKGSTFDVKTPTGTIEVLGTRFLVSEKNEALTVQCFEGKVKTSVGENSYLLTAGTQVQQVSKEMKAEIHPIKNEFPEVAIFNREFRSASLNEIIAEMNDFFGVNIELDINSNQNFTGTIETGSIKNALEIVCSSLQLEYKFINTYTIKVYKL